MKLFLVTALMGLSLSISTPLRAADPIHGVASAQAALADGVVKKVDKAAGKLVIAHGPLPGGMPAMTMAFRVKEAAWVDQVKEGQKIRFASEDVNGVLTVVRLEVPK